MRSLLAENCGKSEEDCDCGCSEKDEDLFDVATGAAMAVAPEIAAPVAALRTAYKLKKKLRGETAKKQEWSSTVESFGEDLENVKAVLLERFEVDGLREAVFGLVSRMDEAGPCGGNSALNHKTGSCMPLPADLMHVSKHAMDKSSKIRTNQDHATAYDAHARAANDLHAAGFRQLARVHATRATAHRTAAAG